MLPGLPISLLPYPTWQDSQAKFALLLKSPPASHPSYHNSIPYRCPIRLAKGEVHHDSTQLSGAFHTIPIRHLPCQICNFKKRILPSDSGIGIRPVSATLACHTHTNKHTKRNLPLDLSHLSLVSHIVFTRSTPAIHKSATEDLWFSPLIFALGLRLIHLPSCWPSSRNLRPARYIF